MAPMTSAERNEMDQIKNVLLSTPASGNTLKGRSYLQAYKMGDLDALRCYAKFHGDENAPSALLVNRVIRALRTAGIKEVFPIITREHTAANRDIVDTLSSHNMEMTNAEYNIIVPLATLNHEYVELIADLWINRSIRSTEELSLLVSEASSVEKPLTSGVL